MKKLLHPHPKHGMGLAEGGGLYPVEDRKRLNGYYSAIIPKRKSDYPFCRSERNHMSTLQLLYRTPRLPLPWADAIQSYRIGVFISPCLAAAC